MADGRFPRQGCAVWWLDGRFAREGRTFQIGNRYRYCTPHMSRPVALLLLLLLPPPATFCQQDRPASTSSRHSKLVECSTVALSCRVPAFEFFIRLINTHFMPTSLHASLWRQSRTSVLQCLGSSDQDQRHYVKKKLQRWREQTSESAHLPSSDISQMRYPTTSTLD